MKWLVDTSVWIDHLRSSNPALVSRLADKQVLIHPIVLGELTCGNFKVRHEVLGNLKLLPKAAIATFEEAMQLVEAHSLFGTGLGFSDAQILASALLSEAGVFTHDQAMLAALKGLGISSN